MTLRISHKHLAVCAACKDDAVLGIIQRNGVVLLTVSGAHHIRGHRQWIQADGVKNVWRGFSILVRDGRVTALIRTSELNPPPDYLLELEIVEELERLLPAAGQYRRFGD